MISIIKNKTLKITALGLFLLLLFCLPEKQLLLAADPVNAGNWAQQILDSTAQNANIVGAINTNTPTIYTIIGEIINIILGFLGVVFLGLIIFGGILWMTAAGNEEKVKKSATLMTQAAIGLAIVLFAFLITNFVIFKIISLAAAS